jgi:hypothetical protein
MAAALRRVCAKIPEYPYAGLDGVIKFKQIPSSESSAYTFGWNEEHPVRSAEYTEAAWKYNQITVEGAVTASSTYLGSSLSFAEQLLVGSRRKFITDRSLTSNAQCAQRAAAELAYYEALSKAVDLEVLPCHGLEMFDVITLTSSPWGGSSYSGRVAAITEYHMPGRYEQQLTLSAANLTPSPALPIEPSPLPSPTPPPGPSIDPPLYASPTLIGDVTDDFVTNRYLPQDAIRDPNAETVGPAALTAFGVTGAIVRATATITASTASAIDTAFFNAAGRAAVAGDALLAYDNNGTAAYRLFVKEQNTASRWTYYTASGTI